jgi:hypothetical protein
MLNARHGGWSSERAERAMALLRGLFAGRVELSSLRG